MGYRNNLIIPNCLKSHSMKYLYRYVSLLQRRISAYSETMSNQDAKIKLSKMQIHLQYREKCSCFVMIACTNQCQFATSCSNITTKVSFVKKIDKNVSHTQVQIGIWSKHRYIGFLRESKQSRGGEPGGVPNTGGAEFGGEQSKSSPTLIRSPFYQKKLSYYLHSYSPSA